MTDVTLSPFQVSISTLFDRVEALFKQAELALKKEQFDLAAHFFQAAHDKDPENLKLMFKEAKLWHRFGNTHASKPCFVKGYRAYRRCFNETALAPYAYEGAVTLKIDEYLQVGSFNAIIDALKLIDRIEVQASCTPWTRFELQKSICLFYKAKHHKDKHTLTSCQNLLLKLYKQEPSAELASLIADVYKLFYTFNNHPSLLLEAISFRKEANNLDSDNLSYLTKLADDYKTLYQSSLDESQIQNFHDICELGSLIHPDETSLYLNWAEGLIDMGIHSEKTEWVKLGVEKSHEALRRSGPTLPIDLLIARGQAYLGQKLDRLSHIQEAFDRIKNFEEDPTNSDLTLAIVTVLSAYGHYYQEVDYFYQAIERLQESLSFDRTLRGYWYQMSKLYFDIALIENNLLALDLSLRMIDKTISFYQCPETLLMKGLVTSRIGEFKQNAHLLEEALQLMEIGLNYYPSIFQPKTSHYFEHAKTLDLCGAYCDDESVYTKALDILAQIILINPHYPQLHHQIALTQFHLAESTLNPELLKKSLLHFKMAAQSSDNDAIYVDWAVACLALSEMVETTHEALFLQHEAANKLKKALKHGQVQAYYFMACLCCICHEHDKALNFLKIAERHDALPSWEDLSMDEWLSPLQSHDEFIKLIERQEMKRA